MSTKISRAEYLKSHPRASAWAELAVATNEQLRITPGPVRLEEGSFAGKRALILVPASAG
jgi:monoamine oxidase